MRYFLVTYLRKANGQIDEQVAISKRVKPADISMCNVIMDFGSRKVDKCVIEGKNLKEEMTWERLTEYYRQVYPNLIEQLENEVPTENKK